MTSSAATAVTASAATLNGNVTSDGGSLITERGFVYKTSSGVTITDNKTTVAGTTGSYSLNLSALTGATTYYFKAYAVNANGTTLSSPELSFTTAGNTPPSLTAAGNATVDAPFAITFTDNSAWRGNITSVTVNGSPLTTSAYTVSAGQITFTPANDAADSLIRTNGSKSIAVLATTYSSDPVTQIIAAGVAAKLAITTQPTTTAGNGAVMPAQPVVVVQDQFGNQVASSANVTAAVGAGAWTIGGTTTKAAVSGVTTFTDLTATSVNALSGAAIAFSANGLAGVTSSGFNIGFTAGNLAVLLAAASTTNTTCSLMELNTMTAGQTPSQTIPISGSGSSALRFSGSARTAPYLAASDDGTLLAFVGGNSADTTAAVNLIPLRGVGTVNAVGSFSLPTTYTGTTTGSGNPPRGATSVNNATWFISDAGGFYSNGSTSAGPSGSYYSVKSFGGIVYVLQSGTGTIVVSTVSAATGGTFTGLPGLTQDANAVDFYLISSGNNGTAFDVLYALDNTNNSSTAGAVCKYSLVSGSWVANGSYPTGFGGFGLCAAKNGSGAILYATTGTGASTANSVVKLTDAAGYNAPINITAGNNVTLYTAASGTILKGIAFAPGSPTITGAAMASAFTTTYGTASTPQSFAVSGAYLSANLTATAPSGFEISSDGTTYGNTAAFTPVSGVVNGTLHVRLKATAAVSGSYNSQHIALTSSGATTVNLTTAASGNAVSQATLTYTANTAAMTYGGTVPSLSGSVSGFVNGENQAGVTTGTLAFTTAASSHTAAGRCAINGSGLAAGNYAFVQAAGNATALTINPLPVLLTGSRVYDGTAATAAAILAIANKVNADDVTVAAGSGSLASANGGSQTITSLGNLALGGSTAGNYTLAGAGGSVRINPAPGTFALVTTKNNAATFAASKIIHFASDAGVTLNVSAVASPSAHGTVALSGGNITYTPATDYTGADSFTYTLSDDAGGSSPGTVTVTVNAVNASSRITDIVVAAGVSATLTASGLPNQAYDVQASDDLGGTWTTINTVKAAANGVVSYTDTDQPNHVSRYYRLAQH